MAQHHMEIKCSQCKRLLDSSFFGRDARKKNGFKSACLECSAAAVRKWRENNPEKAAQISKASYEANKAKRRAKSREWYFNNKEHALAKAKEWRADNEEYVREYGRAYSRKWRANNPERAKENANSGQKRRRKNPVRRLEDAMRNGIFRGLSGITKNGKTFEILGFSVDELVSHLERQFQPGMTWENYGEWHVDHKIPLASFSYESFEDEQFRRAWSLDNLQPLWAKENYSKGAKVLTPANDNKQEHNDAAA